MIYPESILYYIGFYFEGCTLLGLVPFLSVWLHLKVYRVDLYLGTSGCSYVLSAVPAPPLLEMDFIVEDGISLFTSNI